MKYFLNDHKSLVCRRCQIVSLLLFTMGLGIISEKKKKKETKSLQYTCFIHSMFVSFYDSICYTTKFLCSMIEI